MAQHIGTAKAENAVNYCHDQGISHMGITKLLRGSVIPKYICPYENGSDYFCTWKYQLAYIKAKRNFNIIGLFRFISSH